MDAIAARPAREPLGGDLDVGGQDVPIGAGEARVLRDHLHTARAGGLLGRHRPARISARGPAAIWLGFGHGAFLRLGRLTAPTTHLDLWGHESPLSYKEPVTRRFWEVSPKGRRRSPRAAIRRARGDLLPKSKGVRDCKGSHGKASARGTFRNRVPFPHDDPRQTSHPQRSTRRPSLGARRARVQPRGIREGADSNPIFEVGRRRSTPRRCDGRGPLLFASAVRSLEANDPVSQRVAFISFTYKDGSYLVEFPPDTPSWVARVAPKKLSITQALAASLASTAGQPKNTEGGSSPAGRKTTAAPRASLRPRSAPHRAHLAHGLHQ